MRASSSVSAFGWRRSSRRSTASSRWSSSCCAFIDTYSPAAIDTAPATRPAIPAVRTIDAVVPAPAMPRMSDTFETSPSLTPNTVALAAPPVTVRWWLSSASGRSGRATPDCDAAACDGESATMGRYPRSLPRVPTRYDVTREDLATRLAGLPRYRVDQVWHGPLPTTHRSRGDDDAPRESSRRAGPRSSARPHADRRVGERQRHHDQVAVGPRRRCTRRDRADALRGAGDRVRLVAGWLRDGLRVLRHRASRLRPPSVDRGDRGAGRARGSASPVARPPRVQRRVHGHGRTARELRPHVGGDAPAARRPRSVGPAPHDLDRRDHSRHPAHGRRVIAGEPRGLAPRRERRAA